MAINYTKETSIPPRKCAPMGNIWSDHSACHLYKCEYEFAVWEFGHCAKSVPREPTCRADFKFCKPRFEGILASL